MRPLKRCGEGPSQDAKLSSGTATLKLRWGVRGESVAKQVRCRHSNNLLEHNSEKHYQKSLSPLAERAGREVYWAREVYWNSLGGDLGGVLSLDV